MTRKLPNDAVVALMKLINPPAGWQFVEGGQASVVTFENDLALVEGPSGVVALRSTIYLQVEPVKE